MFAEKSLTSSNSTKNTWWVQWHINTNGERKKKNNMQSNSICQWQYCSTSLFPGRGSCGTYAAVLGKQAQRDSMGKHSDQSC